MRGGRAIIRAVTRLAVGSSAGLDASATSTRDGLEKFVPGDASTTRVRKVQPLNDDGATAVAI